MVKNPPANAGDMGLIPRSGRSPGEQNASHSSVLARESPGQRSLAGYSPWGCKESDTTKQLTHIIYIHIDIYIKKTPDL